MFPWSIQWYFGGVFETFTERARRVVFAARFKTGQRGGDAIDVDDLVVALILEDQGMLGSLFRQLHPELPSSGFAFPKENASLFIPPGVASDLLPKIERLLPQSDALPTTAEISASLALKSVLGDAQALQRQLNQNQIEPLHLWAAVLGKSSQAAELLRQAGIDREQALRMLQEEPPPADL